MWSEKIFEIILILFTEICLCLILWSILEKVPWVLKQNMYSIIFVWNVLYKSVKFIQSNVSSKGTVSLLTYGLNDLSIDVKEVLKFLLLLYCCQFLTLGLLIIALYILVLLRRHMNNYNVFLMNCPLCHYIMSIFVSFYLFWLEVYFFLKCVWLHPLCCVCHLLEISFSIPSLSAYFFLYSGGKSLVGSI